MSDSTKKLIRNISYGVTGLGITGLTICGVSNGDVNNFVSVSLGVVTAISAILPFFKVFKK